MSRPYPTKLDVIEEAPGQIACFYKKYPENPVTLVQGGKGVAGFILPVRKFQYNIMFNRTRTNTSSN